MEDIVITSNIDNSITSNILVQKPLNEIPQKPVAKPAIENILTLQGQIVKMYQKKKPLIQQLRMLTDGDYTQKTIDEMEKIEEEIDFITKYSSTLENQMVVIMNEHDVRNIPLMLLE